MNSENRQCQNCHQNFIIEPADFEFYDKIKVPPPTWCPDCRAQRRMIFWNQNNLFRKKDTRTDEWLFSNWPEKADLTIWEHDYWWSDAWDAMSYGQEIDFSKPFLQQLKELYKEVPWSNKSVRNMVNSDYCNGASGMKDCYLCFNGGYAENCLYCTAFINCKETMDVYGTIGAELCYELLQAGPSYQCFFCTDIGEGCQNLWFCKNCQDCQDCFGCVNLKHKKYCVFNKQFSKEEYEKIIKEFETGSYTNIQEIKNKVSELWLKLPHKYYHGWHNDDVSGDYIYDSKNAHNTYEANEMENVRYAENLATNIKDTYDYTSWGENVELLYETVVCGDNCRNIKFCFECWPAMIDSEYCLNCHSSTNLFGCVGLKKKQYCIFNKQYTKEEYEKLVPKIKEHMDRMPYVDVRGRIYKYGEFFPPEFSPLAYNETAAIDYFPKTKIEAETAGWFWRDSDPKEYETTIKSEDLPDLINEAPDSIVNELIRCSDCHRAYRILDRELVFYRRFQIPLPRFCHNCRYKQRMASRNPRQLQKRQCQCAGIKSTNGLYQNLDLQHPSHSSDKPCLNEFQTTYPGEKPDIVYCEECYQREVV